jgi:hypothetical protein
MVNLTFKEKAASLQRPELESALNNRGKRDTFGDLLTSLEFQKGKSSLGTVVGILSHEVRPKVKENPTLRAKVDAVINQATSLWNNEKHLNEEGPYKELGELVKAVTGLETLLGSSYSETKGPLAQARTKLDGDVNKFSKENYPTTKAELDQLDVTISTLKEIRTVTGVPLVPYKTFRRTSREQQVLELLPAIVAGLTNAQEVVDDVSISKAVSKLLQSTGKIKDFESKLEELGAKLADVYKPKTAYNPNKGKTTTEARSTEETFGIVKDVSAKYEKLKQQKAELLKQVESDTSSAGKVASTILITEGFIGALQVQFEKLENKITEAKQKVGLEPTAREVEYEKRTEGTVIGPHHSQT